MTTARVPRWRRLLTHEWSLAALGAILIALFLNADALADPSHTLPSDIWDPSLLAYTIAWGGYALRHDPGGLWDLNAFYPAPYGLAYSDALLGYAPFALVGTGPEAAILRYNLIFIGAHALVLFGGYVLARQLGLRPGPAALAGVALAVAPWRLAQTGHLQVLSSGGMFLALAMLARGHGIRWLRAEGEPVPPVRPGWALAGWLVATWQISLGFGLGVPFLYVLLGCVLVGVFLWARRHRGAWAHALAPRLLVADTAGGVILAAVALLMAQPYLKVLELYPYARRTAATVALYSPPPSGLFTAPPQSTVWGDLQSQLRDGLSGEKMLLPGLVLCMLAAAGLFLSVWPRRVRIGLGVGTIVLALLCLGTNGPAGGHLGYLALLSLPGFEAIRTPGRLIVWVTLCLALLAGGAVGALVPWARQVVGAWLRGRHPRLRSALTQAIVTVPTLLVFIEGLGTVTHAPMPPAPPSLSTAPAPYLVLPMHAVMDMNIMLWSTDRFADTVNGGSGFIPAEWARVNEAVATFPDESSIDYLRAIGVRSVVVLPFRAWQEPLASAATIPIDGLGVTREVHPDAVVFTLDP